MVIEENDFKLISCGDSSLLWDLELKHTVRPKGKPSREEFKEAGFGMPFYTCLKKIANFRVKTKKEIMSIKEYIQEYVQELKNLENLVKDA